MKRIRRALQLAYAALRGRIVEVHLVDATGEWHVIGIEVSQ